MIFFNVPFSLKSLFILLTLVARLSKSRYALPSQRHFDCCKPIKQGKLLESERIEVLLSTWQMNLRMIQQFNKYTSPHPATEPHRKPPNNDHTNTRITIFPINHSTNQPVNHSPTEPSHPIMVGSAGLHVSLTRARTLLQIGTPKSPP